VGKGIGSKIKIGQIDEEDINCYSFGSSKGLFKEEITKIISETVEEYARLDDENTNSGYVLLDKKPSFNLYNQAVKKIVKLEKIEKILRSSNAYFKGYKNKRGLIGATASIAWSPVNDKTYELISYRKKNRWGKKRVIDDDSVKKIDTIFNSTFDNYDYINNHNRIIPNSACPILFGIRGENPADLEEAKSMIKSEKINSWLIFETNQGTDDHLEKKEIYKIKPFQSILTIGTICKDPIVIKGGHVIFRIKDSTGEIDCAAYEPTKEFRNIIKKLKKGDIIEVFGGVREKPLTVNIEKIKILTVVKSILKVENPVCPICGKHMKSKGKNQVYKCIKCKSISHNPIYEEKKRILKSGLYEVPVCARRHLSKPVKRMQP
jgi:tRNA(Ile2)-agmatinylcytidine synthase